MAKCDEDLIATVGIPSSGTRYHFQRRDNDGGPAFPCETPNEIFSGMTLRDYFAAKAMQTLIVETNLTSYAEVVDHAYQMADAMLAERSK